MTQGDVAGLDDLARVVGELLRRRGWFIGLAESCTGGLVSHALTNVAGSSDYVRGGVVAYANEVKRDVVGVPEELLVAHGAVSEPVALALARGVRSLLGTEVGASVTGIAGPTGGTPDKPVGTVYIAASTPLGDRAEHHVWNADRVTNKDLSARALLQLLIALLQGGGEDHG